MEASWAPEWAGAIAATRGSTAGARPGCPLDAGQARELLVAAGQVWLTNVIAFGLLFWELDRGGPVARTQVDRTDLAPARAVGALQS